MPKLSKPAIYVRSKGGYEKTDSRSFYAQGTTFVLRFTDGKKRGWETLPAGTDFATAQRLCLQKELALADAPVAPSLLSNPTLAKPEPVAPKAASANNLLAAIDKHINRCWAEGEHKPATVKAKAFALREFATWAGVRNVEQIDRAVLMQYKDALIAKGQTERTANNKVVYVHAFLHSCGRRDILQKRDWRALKLLQRRTTKGPYSRVEIARMREVADVDERDCLEFFLGTGMRKNQGVATRWSDIDFLNRVARIPTGVGLTEQKKARAARLGIELTARLEARRKRYPNSVFVFETRTGTPDQGIGDLVASAAKKAGVNLEGKSVLHSLRKSFANVLLNDGKMDMYRVSKLLGHSNVRTTELYAEFDSDAEDAGDQIEKILAAGA